MDMIPYPGIADLMDLPAPLLGMIGSARIAEVALASLSESAQRTHRRNAEIKSKIRKKLTAEQTEIND